MLAHGKSMIINNWKLNSRAAGPWAIGKLGSRC